MAVQELCDNAEEARSKTAEISVLTCSKNANPKDAFDLTVKRAHLPLMKAEQMCSDVAKLARLIFNTL